MIRVLIVDDSALVRTVLSAVLSKAADIEVIGVAEDPYVARDKILELRPDVITLDIEMPRMDGLTFLKKLIRHHPMPVVVFSSLSREGGRIALQALELGAIEVLGKPAQPEEIGGVVELLAKKIRQAAAARRGCPPGRESTAATPSVADHSLPVEGRLVALGASTGGPEAIRHVLSRFPRGMPPTLIVQHMVPRFTEAFASRLNDLGTIEVREARDGDELRPGLALVAPGGLHLLVERSGSNLRARVKDGPKVHFQMPAVDVLFRSVARCVGAGAVGVLLTGMGSDGAEGLLAMREGGAHTIAQDEDSSVVFGMPRAAIAAGGALEVLPLDRIGDRIVAVLSQAPTGRVTPEPSDVLAVAGTGAGGARSGAPR